MAIVMGVSTLTYAYVVPFVISGQAADTAAQGGALLADGIGAVDDAMGGALTDTTAQIQGHKDASPAGSGGDGEARQPDAEPTPADKPRSLLHKGIVTKIIDGDTLAIGGTKVRLALVNTPERGEPGYGEAKDFASAQCPLFSQAMYRLDSGQPGGSYDREIGMVWCLEDGKPPAKSLNELLVESGHAVVYDRFCGVSEFSGEHWASCRLVPNL